MTPSCSSTQDPCFQFGFIWTEEGFFFWASLRLSPGWRGGGQSLGQAQKRNPMKESEDKFNCQRLASLYKNDRVKACFKTLCTSSQSWSHSIQFAMFFFFSVLRITVLGNTVSYDPIIFVYTRSLFSIWLHLNWGGFLFCGLSEALPRVERWGQSGGHAKKKGTRRRKNKTNSIAKGWHLYTKMIGSRPVLRHCGKLVNLRSTPCPNLQLTPKGL